MCIALDDRTISGKILRLVRQSVDRERLQVRAMKRFTAVKVRKIDEIAAIAGGHGRGADTFPLCWLSPGAYSSRWLAQRDRIKDARAGIYARFKLLHILFVAVTRYHR